MRRDADQSAGDMAEQAVGTAPHQKSITVTAEGIRKDKKNPRAGQRAAAGGGVYTRRRCHGDDRGESGADEADGAPDLCRSWTMPCGGSTTFY